MLSAHERFDKTSSLHCLTSLIDEPWSLQTFMWMSFLFFPHLSHLLAVTYRSRMRIPSPGPHAIPTTLPRRPMAFLCSLRGSVLHRSWPRPVLEVGGLTWPEMITMGKYVVLIKMIKTYQDCSEQPLVGVLKNHFSKDFDSS